MIFLLLFFLFGCQPQPPIQPPPREPFRTEDRVYRDDEGDLRLTRRERELDDRRDKKCDRLYDDIDDAEDDLEDAYNDLDTAEDALREAGVTASLQPQQSCVIFEENLREAKENYKEELKAYTAAEKTKRQFQNVIVQRKSDITSEVDDFKDEIDEDTDIDTADKTTLKLSLNKIKEDCEEDTLARCKTAKTEYEAHSSLSGSLSSSFDSVTSVVEAFIDAVEDTDNKAAMDAYDTALRNKAYAENKLNEAQREYDNCQGSDQELTSAVRKA
ncbi:MAG: hypothetical protein OXB86_05310, partial [Bdellovibrionales bacterium]|nr:hypothetical protein [Bdellovibrionales bacterium]